LILAHYPAHEADFDIVLGMTSAFTFLREVYQELIRVTWPTSRELVRYTIVVLFTVALIGGFIALVDLSIVNLLQRFVYTTH
jgi:preprotein translocase subunit SecE